MSDERYDYPGCHLRLAESNQRIWLDDSDCQLTSFNPGQEEFDIVDCELCFKLLTLCASKENLICCSSSYRLCNLPYNLVQGIISTKLPEDFYAGMYTVMNDWEKTKRAKTYGDLFKFFAASRNRIVLPNRDDNSLPEICLDFEPWGKPCERPEWRLMTYEQRGEELERMDELSEKQIDALEEKFTIICEYYVSSISHGMRFENLLMIFFDDWDRKMEKMPVRKTLKFGFKR